MPSIHTSLFDIQINGFAGGDFQQPDLAVQELRHAVNRLAIHETQRFFAMLINDSTDSLEAKFANLESIRSADQVVAEAICGYHLEGPWLSPEPGYRCAHDPQFMGPPDLHDFERLQKAANGHIISRPCSKSRAASARTTTGFIYSLSKCCLRASKDRNSAFPERTFCFRESRTFSCQAGGSTAESALGMDSQSC